MITTFPDIIRPWKPRLYKAPSPRNQTIILQDLHYKLEKQAPCTATPFVTSPKYRSLAPCMILESGAREKDLN